MMTKTFMIYSPDYDEACGACYRINQRLVRLSITDFDDCFFFDAEDTFDFPSKHNRISRILTTDAIEKHGLYGGDYIEFYCK